MGPGTRHLTPENGPCNSMQRRPWRNKARTTYSAEPCTFQPPMQGREVGGLLQAHRSLSNRARPPSLPWGQFPETRSGIQAGRLGASRRGYETRVLIRSQG